jgi:Glucose / Sorbosone dehydrogenase
MPHLARRFPRGLVPLLVAACATGLAAQTVTVEARDWLRMPASGNLSISGASLSANPNYITRTNFLRPEPGNTGRVWICDLNGNLLILPAASADLASRSSALFTPAAAGTPYLDFNGSVSGNTNDRTCLPTADGTTAVTPNGLFRLFIKQSGYANGLVTFQFDPEYPTNGRFYTVHIESDSANGAANRLPLGGAGTKHTGLNVTGYASTSVVAPPAGGTSRQAVLIEWTDTNPADTVFQGTAREILRIGYTGTIHPLGDLTFNPLATDASHPDWGCLYLANGDGGAGESNSNDDGVTGLTGGDRHYFPQRLDTLLGKTLRIIPDLARRTAVSTVSANGRYRIPNDNPFVATSGARPELWTVGHRNPHRFVWDVPTATLLVCEIGLHAWEEVNVIEPGRNYGYPEREGAQRLIISTGADNQTLVAVPSPDTIPVRIGSSTTGATVTPTYPVIAYSHTAPYGDAISSGLVYRGRAAPALQGRFVFGDITTGKVFHADFAAMLAAHAANGPASQAAFEALQIQWDDPATPAGPQTYTRFFEIVQTAYHTRGGTDADLPGGSTISGTGRADIRLVADAEGELYVISKSDGMIRALNAVPARPAWLATYFTTPELAQPTVSGDLADPDGDGQCNLLEYALDTDPRSAAGAPALVARATPGQLALDYPAAHPELRYTVEASTDLVTWSSAGVSDTAALDPAVRTATIPRAEGERSFLRLRITLRQ